MSRFNYIRESVGKATPTVRFANEDDASTPDNEIDMSEWGPSHRIGLGERLKRRGRSVAVFGLAAVAAFGILFAWARQVAVGFVTNPLVQIVTVIGVIVLAVYVAGVRSTISRIKSLTFAAFLTPNGIRPFIGRYEVAEDGTEILVPYQGYDWLGRRNYPLPLSEMGEDIARTAAKRNRDPDDPVRIRLDDCRYGVRQTAFGTFIVGETDGLQVDQFGQHSDVYAAPPSMVSEDNFVHLYQRLEHIIEREIPELKDTNRTLEEQKEQLRQRLREGDDDKLERFLEFYRLLREAEQPRHDDRDRIGQSPDGERDGEPVPLGELDDTLEEYANGEVPQ